VVSSASEAGVDTRTANGSSTRTTSNSGTSTGTFGAANTSGTSSASAGSTDSYTFTERITHTSSESVRQTTSLYQEGRFAHFSFALDSVSLYGQSNSTFAFSQAGCLTLADSGGSSFSS